MKNSTENSETFKLQIEDSYEENSINIFLEDNQITISSTYNFGAIGITKILSKEEIQLIINFLSKGL
jgi:hypothetical protein